MRVNEDVRHRIVSHYEEHAEVYEELWTKLDTVHDRFRSGDREAKISYLKLSYINSVISVRSPVSQHENALNQLMVSRDLETAISSTIFYRTKLNAIRQSLDEEKVWRELANDLDSGSIDAAHRRALNHLRYIGPVKAPFILAKLGYTEKMCLDSNVVEALDLDREPSNLSLEKYNELCKNIQYEFPSLTKELEPFHLQWVIFDWQRLGGSDNRADRGPTDKSEKVTSHDAWFNAVLSDQSTVQNVVEALA